MSEEPSLKNHGQKSLIGLLLLQVGLEALRRLTARAMLLMLAMPLNPLFHRPLRRHPILLVPKLVHGALAVDPATHRAIRNITQLSTTADPQNSAKQ
jgi:hypothetical protein